MVIRHLLIFIALLLAWPAWAQDSLRLILPDTRPVTGEMIPVTIRGEYTGAITLEDMRFPDSAAYDWIQLGPDDWHDERVDGKQRRVLQRHIAVFARKPGNLTIGPVTHVLTKAETNSRNRVEVTAPPASIPIQPYPAPGRPTVARSLKVTDELSGDPARIRDDQTILRRITLTAEGTMAHLLPARPELREPWLISFTSPERRETRLTEHGPVAFVQWEWHLRPITGEQGTLPPMRFSWFDTNKRELRGEITPPIPFGYGKLNQNIGGTAKPGGAQGWLLAALATGGALGLIAMLWGKGARPLSALAQHWHRLRPNPALPALRLAAGQPDLFALRRAAEDYARAEQAAGRAAPRAALARLDRALFGPAPTDFDSAAFLRELTGR
ncbi:BatD family protein [Paracoccus litorisediminis]|uniref:Oxygen tolerance n=1 Tax=Paracoccus litorisediminis TaxID=2006130 RepID=A0A844HJD0_9RHOB|nr:BatD family protein [Paracoccus litorisediminis]MTH60263.1 hypothetical protein [Paracoccus litorisediminis]